MATIQQPVPRSRFESIPLALEQHFQGADDTYQETESKTKDRRQSELTDDAARKSKVPLTNGSQPASNDYVERWTKDSPKRAKPQSSFRPSPSASGLNALAPVFKAGTTGFFANDSTAGMRMRPTAPAFTLAAISQKFLVSREFSFSSAGPSFKQDGAEARTTLPDSAFTVEGSNAIFGPVKVSQDAKATRKSKAVPILRPRDEWSMKGQESEVQEDETGRITQAEGRQKRLRRSSEDGVHAARFSSPANTAEHTSMGDLPPSNITEYDHVRQHSMSLEKAAQAANQLKEIIDNLSASDGLSTQEQAAREPDFTFNDVSEAIAFDTARPRSPSAVTKASQRDLEDNVDVKQTGPTDAQPAICGSASKDISSSLTPSPAKSNLGSRQAYRLPDHDKLAGLRRREPSASLSGSDSSTSSATEDIPKAGARSALSANSVDVDVRDAQKLAEGIADGFSYIEPSYEEIDAVMKHLNEEDLQILVGRNSTPQGADFPLAQPQHDVPDTVVRGDPSHVYKYKQQSGYNAAGPLSVHAIVESLRSRPSSKVSCISDFGQHPSHRLPAARDAAVGHTDDTPLSGEEGQYYRKRRFPDTPVNDAIDNVLQQRLAPLERLLVAIQDSLTDLRKESSGGAARTSDKVDISDADDEDDSGSVQGKTRSPIRDRKYDKLKSLISEIATAQQKPVAASELVGITESIKELKTFVHGAHPSFADVKTVVEEAIGKQMRGRSGPITSSHHSATAEKNQLQITGLESMLKIAEGRAEDELKARRATEDALADSQRLLRLALQDAAEQRESAEETERSLSAFHEERHEVLRQTALLEGAQESLQKTASELAEKNGALEGTLEEYRLSSTQWREEIEHAKIENNDLRRTVNALRTEMEDTIRGRQALRAKLDQLQEEMVSASQSLARDQSIWGIKEEEHKARCEFLVADCEREHQKRKDLENEIAALSKDLRLLRDEHGNATDRYERQIQDQKDGAILESARMHKMIDTDNRAAASELSSMLARLENIVADLRSQLDQATEAASTERAEHQRLLQEASASQIAALQERQDFHDQIVAELKQQHEQISQSATQEKQHIELQSSDRLALAEEKLEHYHDKTRHLEENLEIAKSAAQAAVQAVQSKQSTSGASCQRGLFQSGSFGSLPEKTSPQALRESILVLQEQLQDRESQIERLEQRLSAVDTDAPTRCKAQETEISWLRELLNVRIDDLEDLIAALAQPVYNREAIKDAAIRLKANIQMEQQEKERAHSGVQSFPAFASISNLTSSTRSLPLAAAAAGATGEKDGMPRSPMHPPLAMTTWLKRHRASRHQPRASYQAC